MAKSRRKSGPKSVHVKGYSYKRKGKLVRIKGYSRSKPK